MFNWYRKKAVDYFSPAEKEKIVTAIRKAEQRTSGEIRVYIESKCRFVNALDRAIELFDGLNMYTTKERNAVLVYIAMKDRQLAIYADQGIYQKMGSGFWNDQVKVMMHHFNKNDYADGIATIVDSIGKALYQNFPYDAKTDTNELSDDIVFGN
ncbi:MAG: TPM domain-containing protein [Chitinophagaceae bacterium]|jgi:uncharacterized membrane protein